MKNTVLFISLGLMPLLSMAQTPDAGQILNEQQQLQQQYKQPPATIPAIKAPATQDAKGAEDVNVVINQINFAGGERVITREALQAIVKQSLGKTHTFKEIRQVTNQVTDYIKAQGYLLGFAYLPKQEINNGTLLIRLQLGKFQGGAQNIEINQYNARLNRQVISNTMAKAIYKKDQQYVKTQHLERGLLLLNDLPGVTAKATIKQGSEPGTSQLALTVNEDKLLHTKLTTDNYGNRYTGKARVGGQLQVNNPSKVGDALILNGIKTEHSYQAMLRYERPIAYNGLKLSTNLNYLNYSLGKDLKPLRAKGSAFNASAALNYPFIRSRAQNLWGNIAFESRKIKSEALSTNTQDKKLKLIETSIYGDKLDYFLGRGITNYNAKLTLGNVDLSDNTADLSADKNGAKTNGAYQKLSLTLSRLQYLQKKYSIYGRFKGQYTNQNLDSSEKMFLGGPTGIRAYPIGEANGDRGWLFNLEARADTNIISGKGKLQVIGFYDAGGIQLNTNTWAGAINNAENKNSYMLQGIGVGINYSNQDNFNISATLAKTIGSNPGRDSNGNNTDGKDQHTQLWLQGQVNF